MISKMLKKKKRMAGEKAQDEVCLSASQKFTTDVCFVVLDAIITSISSRFSQSREIIKDLTLLSPERIIRCAKENHTEYESINLTT